MRYKVRVSEQKLARKVQARLRRRRVWVHNLLVRFIVKQVMDILVEMPPMTRELFCQGWLRNKHQTPPRSWRRLIRHLAGAYTERIMQERGLRYWAYLRRLKAIDRFTDAEMLALREARQDAVERGDQDLISAINKAVMTMRPVDNVGKKSGKQKPK